TFVIDTGAANTLKIGATNTINAISTFNNGNQTLEAGTSVALTISGAQTVTGGKILLDSGATLADSSGIILGGTGQLTGQGTVTANLTYTGSGTGTVQASGGA